MAIISRTKLYRYPEYVWEYKSRLIYRHLACFEVSCKDATDAAEIAIDRLQCGSPAMMLRAGNPPWIVVHSAGLPPMAFRTEEVLENFFKPPFHSEKFIPLSYDKSKGWLFYYRPMSFEDSENFVWCPEKLRGVHEVKTHLERQINDVVVVNEPKLMESIKSPSEVDFKNFTPPDSQWVKYRIKMWKDNLILPGNFVYFGYGAALHLLRLSLICNCSAKDAWGIMYSGVVLK